MSIIDDKVLYLVLTPFFTRDILEYFYKHYFAQIYIDINIYCIKL